MNTKKFTVEEMKKRRAERSLKYYYENRDELKKVQYAYRYPKSIQSYVDEKWDELKNKSNSMLTEWAINHGLDTSKRSMICFFMAVNKNKTDGQKVINQRIKEMNKLNKKIKRNERKSRNPKS
jgi:hypothetical protein